MKGASPLLVLGLDGATFDVLAPLAREGRLPHLARLIEEGASTRLPSTVPAMTFPSWTSLVTAREPGEHGLFDFTQKVEGAYRIRFTNRTHADGESIFAAVSRAGGSVLSLGMPATFPPESVRGLLVCGFDAPVSTGSGAGGASDPGLYRELEARVGPWMRPDLDESATDDARLDLGVDTLLDRVERKTRFALAALRALEERGDAPDLACVVYSESDTVCHHYWRDHDPDSPRHDPRASARRRGAVAAVYRALDAACGRLLAAMPAGTACVAVSDHGAGGASRHVVHLNRKLEEAGLLVRAPGGSERRGRLARGGRDLALRLLPTSLAETVFRHSRPLAARVESAARFAGFDWSRTLAFSEEVNTQPGVWINLRGREAHGCVEPEHYEATVRRVVDALRDWKLPNGDPVVARARHRDAVYRGGGAGRAPDVVVELGEEDGYGLSLVATPWERGPGPSLRRLAEHELAGGRGRGMNGVHRPEGLWIARGLRDMRVPEGMADAGLRLRTHLGLGSGGASPSESPERSYTDEEERAVEARLRALGYLD